MLYWKSRPISSLSKRELQQALQDAVPMFMGIEKGRDTNRVLSAFVTGMFIGLIFAGFSVAAAHVIF